MAVGEPVAGPNMKLHIPGEPRVLLLFRTWEKAENSVAYIGSRRTSRSPAIEHQAAPTILQREQRVRRQPPPLARNLNLPRTTFAKQQRANECS